MKVVNCAVDNNKCPSYEHVGIDVEEQQTLIG